MSKLKSEVELKEKLGIENWDELESEDKFIEYVRLSQEIDRDLQKEIIKTVPNYLDVVGSSIDGIKIVVEEKRKGTDAHLNVISNISDNLKKLSKKDDLTPEDIRYISEQMMQLADLVNQLHKRDTQFWDSIVNGVKWLGGIVLAMTGYVIKNRSDDD